MRSNLKHIEQKIQTVSAHPGFRKYFFNTGWMFVEKALRLIAGLFIGAYVARYLGPGQYGLLNYALSLVTLFSVLAWLGLDAIVVKRLVETGETPNSILGTAFILKFAAASILFLSFILVTGYTNISSGTGDLILIIAAGSLLEIFGVITFLFESRAQSKFVVISQMISLSIVSIFRVYLVWTHAPVFWFAAAYTIDLSIVAIGLVSFYSLKVGSIFRWRFSRQMAMDLLGQSWPLILSAVSVTIYMKIDQIMIKWMLGNEATGNYGVAVRLSELWNFIPIAICGSVFPAILNAKKISEQFYLNRLQWLYDLMVGISVAIAIPMTFLSNFVVTLLFGEAYHNAGGVLSLYIWSAVFTFLGVANGKWIVSENLQIYRMISVAVAAIINVVLNILFIRTMGINGAALATLISYAVAAYFSLLFSNRTRVMFVSCSRSLNLIGLTGRVIQYIRRPIT